MAFPLTFDPVLALMGRFRADARAQKIESGVGVSETTCYAAISSRWHAPIIPCRPTTAPPWCEASSIDALAEALRVVQQRHAA